MNPIESAYINALLTDASYVPTTAGIDNAAMRDRLSAGAGGGIDRAFGGVQE